MAGEVGWPTSRKRSLGLELVVGIGCDCEVQTVRARPDRNSWARELQRAYDNDRLQCPNGGGGKLKTILVRPDFEKSFHRLQPQLKLRYPGHSS
jgi:hypothetical protein